MNIMCLLYAHQFDLTQHNAGARAFHLFIIKTRFRDVGGALNATNKVLRKNGQVKVLISSEGSCKHLIYLSLDVNLFADGCYFMLLV